VNERRKDRRYPVEIAASIKLGKKVLTGRLMNASFNGLAVQVPDAPGTRQLVQLEVQLPAGGEKFSAHAMVIHGGTTHVGLEFFGRSAKPAWDEFVQQLSRGIVPPAAPNPLPEAAAPPPPPPPPPEPAVMVPSIVSGGPAITTPLAFGGPRPAAPPGPPPPPPRSNPGTVPMAPARPPAPPPPAPSRPVAPPPTPAAAPGPYSGPERRRAPRVALAIELRMRTPRAALDGQTFNISMAGILALVNDPSVTPGEPVAINLLQPRTSMTFRRDGMVSRVYPVDGGRMLLGIDFAPLDSMQEVLFADFLNTAYATLTSGG
jgi:hypothetical protein